MYQALLADDSAGTTTMAPAPPQRQERFRGRLRWQPRWQQPRQPQQPQQPQGQPQPPSQQDGQFAPPGYYQAQPQIVPAAPAATTAETSGLPSWVLPVAIGGGVLLLLMVMMSGKK
ncbi:MAG TPA: hypothetical protein VGB07_36205 [Blastocatellia bacterium]